MARTRPALAVAAALLATALSCSRQPAPQLVLYAGRSKSLVQPIIQQFTAETSIQVRVRYGQSALTLLAEGDRSRADVFWAQDAGALATVANHGRFAELPAPIVQLAEPFHGNASRYWVATSGRARVLAYSPKAEAELPATVFDLAEPRYRSRVGWAPRNASFQAFVTAMRKTVGEDRARAWLTAMKDNGARDYPKNPAILDGIANGEVDFGLPNHYYLIRFKSKDPDYPVEQTQFEPGDIGNLINVAGIGMLKSAPNPDEALALIRFLLSSQAQQFFADETFEYPVIDGLRTSRALVDAAEIRRRAPDVKLDVLEDLEGTLELLRETELLE